MKIDKIIQEMIDGNMFGKEDIAEAKTILTWMDKGREEAEKISKEAVDNLVKCGFMDEKTKKLCGDFGKDGEDMGMWFLLALNGAKGFVKQTSE